MACTLGSLLKLTDPSPQGPLEFLLIDDQHHPLGTGQRLLPRSADVVRVAGRQVLNLSHDSPFPCGCFQTARIDLTDATTDPRLNES